MEALLGQNYKVTKAGKRTTDSVGVGKVHIATGQTIKSESGVGFNGTNVFSVTYQGKDAEAKRWLQFIWREVIGIDEKGKSTAKSGPVSTMIGTYPLTEGGTQNTFGSPKKENFNVDSGSDVDPYVEGGVFPGLADRTAESTTFFDPPGGALDVVRGVFDGGAKAVVSRVHAHQFLVDEGKTVQYQSRIDIEWRFNDPKQVDTPPDGDQKVGLAVAASALPTPMAERLHEQYPAFRHLK